MTRMKECTKDPYIAHLLVSKENDKNMINKYTLKDKLNFSCMICGSFYQTIPKTVHFVKTPPGYL